jgi:hypothetical protein
MPRKSKMTIDWARRLRAEMAPASSERCWVLASLRDAYLSPYLPVVASTTGGGARYLA